MPIPTNATRVTYSFPVEKEYEPGFWDGSFSAGVFTFDLTQGSTAGLSPEIIDNMAESSMDDYLSNLTIAISGAPDHRVVPSRSYTMPNQTGDTWPTP